MGFIFRSYVACTPEEAQEVLDLLKKYNVGGGIKAVRKFNQEWRYTEPYVVDPPGTYEYEVQFNKQSDPFTWHNIASMRSSFWFKVAIYSWWVKGIEDSIA